MRNLLNKTTVSFTISTLLHMTLLLTLGSPGGYIGVMKPSSEATTNQVEKPSAPVDIVVIEKEQSASVKETTKIYMVDQSQTSMILPDILKTDPDCPHWYGGIGIEEERGIIEKVFHGYCAEAAGLQVGDIIQDPTVIILGEPGTVLDLNILRNNLYLHFSITRCKVCY